MRFARTVEPVKSIRTNFPINKLHYWTLLICEHLNFWKDGVFKTLLAKKFSKALRVSTWDLKNKMTKTLLQKAVQTANVYRGSQFELLNGSVQACTQSVSRPWFSLSGCGRVRFDYLSCKALHVRVDRNVHMEIAKNEIFQMFEAVSVKFINTRKIRDTIYQVVRLSFLATSMCPHKALMKFLIVVH